MANNSNQYFINLRNLMEMMGKTNEAVAPTFDKLRQAIDDQSLDKLSDAEFKNIKSEFIEASDNYLEGINLIKSVQAPAKLIGTNLNLIKYYQGYANATKAMTDALDDSKKAVDLKAFNQSEEDQDTFIEKFNTTLNKLLSMR